MQKAIRHRRPAAQRIVKETVQPHLVLVHMQKVVRLPLLDQYLMLKDIVQLHLMITHMLKDYRQLRVVIALMQKEAQLLLPHMLIPKDIKLPHQAITRTQKVMAQLLQVKHNM